MTDRSPFQRLFEIIYVAQARIYVTWAGEEETKSSIGSIATPTVVIYAQRLRRFKNECFQVISPNTVQPRHATISRNDPSQTP